MANLGGKLTMKVLTVAIGIPIGIASRSAVERVWIAAGPDRPREAKDDGVQWADAIGWAALMGVGMTVADLLTRKSAEEAYRFFLGAKPGIAQMALERVNRIVGRDIVVGAHGPSFNFVNDARESAEVIEMINASGATCLSADATVWEWSSHSHTGIG